MRQKLRRRRGDSDDSEQREPAGTAGRTAASGADRIWHSPAAGLPTPVADDGGNRSRQGGTGEPSEPAVKGTYRVLTEEVAARSRSAAGGTDRPPSSGGTAALSGPGADGTGRPANGDTAAVVRAAVSSREPRPAVGDIAGRGGRAAGTGTTADDGAGTTADDGAGPAWADSRPARGGAARQGNGAAWMLGNAPGGSHEPLLDDAAALRANWQRLQGDFVDDPRAAVSNAADLVEHTAQALVGALRQRQRELRGLWDETLAGDAGAAREGGWLAGGWGRGDRPGQRVRQGAGRLPGWLGRGRVRDAGPGGERLEDGTTADGEAGVSPEAASLNPEAAGVSLDAGVSPEAAGGAPAADTTENLRLVMQRYRALFNQICRP